MGIRWNNDLAREEASKHKTKMTLWEFANGCYGYIRKHNLWEELAPHIPNPPTFKLSIRAWKPLSASMEALKYKTRKELYEGYISCYSYISKNGWDILAPHLKPTPKCRKWRTYYENNPIEGAKAGIFYVIHFIRDDGVEFIKIGITSKSIKERYKDKQYRRYTMNIITELHTTNLISAEIEDNFLTANQHNRFSFDNHIEFDGYTETLNIELMERMVTLEDFKQFSKFAEPKRLNENTQF